MTDLQYLILGLIGLAVIMNLGRIKTLLQGQAPGPSKPTATTTRVIETAGVDRPMEPADIAALLHQTVSAEAQTRAVRRSVESMIENQSKQVQLTWVTPSSSTGSDAPKA